MKKVIVAILLIIFVLIPLLFAAQSLKQKTRIYNFYNDNRLNEEFDNVYYQINKIVKEFNKINNKCSLYLSNDISLTGGTFIGFTQEYFDIGDMHSTSINNENITITQTDKINFIVNLQCKITPATSFTNVILSIYKNNNIIGKKYIYIDKGISSSTYIDFTVVDQGQKEDIIKLYIETDNAITIDIKNNTDTNEEFGLGVYRI